MIEREIRVALREDEVIHSLYTDPPFNRNENFLTIFYNYYSGKIATETINESVFSVAQYLNHGGGVTTETLERRAKNRWNCPDPLAVGEAGPRRVEGANYGGNVSSTVIFIRVQYLKNFII